MLACAERAPGGVVEKISFKILGLDCAEEVAVLKRELGPLVGEDKLEFDVLNGRMIVGAADDPALVRQIEESVGSTGMRAIRWEDFVSHRAEEESFWQRRGREVMCAVSGACLVAGFLSHWMFSGSIVAALSGAEGLSGGGYPLVSRMLYLAATIAGGWYVFPKAVFSAKRMMPDINLLMAVAVAGALIIGEWFEAGAVTFLFSLALLLESWSVSRARRAIQSLMTLSPEIARVVAPGTGHVREHAAAEVQPGAVVLVRPGERVPLDGRVTKGETAIDQAPITGESMPAAKKPGDEVFAGTINGDGVFEFEVTRPACDTTLARLIHLVEEAQSRRAPSQQWVERFARVYTPAMMILALLVWIVPPLFFGSDWNQWLYQALVLLVIACPCALVISTPVTIIAGLTAATRAGVLVKGGSYLEAPSRIRAIAFDKTGTLSHGRPEVQQVVPMNGHTPRELLERAAALEADSLHPLARSVVARAQSEGVQVAAAENHQAILGRGAQGTIGGKPYWIGSHRFVHDLEMEEGDFHELATQMEDAGHSLVIVGNQEHICGVISVADEVRGSAPVSIGELRKLGVERIVMLTGDNQRAAEAIAKAVGVDEFHAELLPEDKVRVIRELQQKYGAVAMVGDGVNDAPAMAASSLGIAMGAAGSDAAIETADIALMSDDLHKLPWLVRHSRSTLAIIKQNVMFALGVKLLFVLLAIAGLATLWMAIAADMGATLVVVFNGLRLLRAADEAPASESNTLDGKVLV